MGGRILHMAPGRARAPVHGAIVVAACLAAVVAGIGLARWGGKPPSPAAQPAVAKPAAAPQAAVATAMPLPRTAPVAAVARDTASAAAAACPLQSLTLARRDAPLQTVCMDATSVQQTGSVRSYLVNAGDAEGWTLRLDMIDRRLSAASLQARDGRAYACQGGRCQGLVQLSQVGAVPALSLRGLRLPKVMPPGAGTSAAANTEMTVSAELRVPADEQVPGLACVGPSLSIAAASGTARNFCGQGGAGVEIGDSGARHYRFQDLEGRTLMVAVDAAQQVVAVELEPYACRGPACTGASTTSAEPDNPLAERSFFFGRTALHEGRPADGAGPGVVLSGSLVMPAQQ